MAGGPLSPVSAVPGDATGRLFPLIYNGAGGNGVSLEEGLGVMASLSADSTWELRFHIPPTVPTGTMKLRLLALANATSGAAKVTVKDGRAPAGSNPSSAALTSETQVSLTWAAGNNDQYLETKVTLTTVPQGNDVLVVGLVFNTTGWTLAVPSAWIATLIWE